MDVASLVQRFEAIGARAEVSVASVKAFEDPIRVDVRTDRRKVETFELLVREDAWARVVDASRGDRHLLLHAGRESDAMRPYKFLCGHDERHWFVAGVPDDRGVSGVKTAMEALKPSVVRDAQLRAGLRERDRHTRKNSAFMRQGEWFFLHDAAFAPGDRPLLRNEPFRRSTGGKAHVAEFACRFGGETVMVSYLYPGGLDMASYRQLLLDKPEKRKHDWRSMKRDATLYVKGRIRHSDHATLVLDGWHRVVMNDESRAPSMRSVSFID
jgi:hypothetical protein